ncbi:hypothetical protein [Alishewanella phage vB_AspM_Slicko01]|nr:hypothetical protein [Alishewanella phage vB_AspM_Slicko01]
MSHKGSNPLPSAKFTPHKEINMFNPLHLFHSQSKTTFLGRAGDEVNGLAKDSIPENCTIIDSFLSEHSKDRREFYLLDSCGYRILLRICSADKTIGGYEEFVVIHGISNKSEEQKEITALFERWKESLDVRNA